MELPRQRYDKGNPRTAGETTLTSRGGTNQIEILVFKKGNITKYGRGIGVYII